MSATRYRSQAGGLWPVELVHLIAAHMTDGCAHEDGPQAAVVLIEELYANGWALERFTSGPTPEAYLEVADPDPADRAVRVASAGSAHLPDADDLADVAREARAEARRR